MADNRACQFMPFASLKGYYDEINKREKVRQPKRELSEDEETELNNNLLQLQRGSMAIVTYYKSGFYETVEGMVSDVNIPFRYITIVKTKIPLDDICEICRR